MAYIGCLGDIPFQVSSDTVQTLNNAKWTGSAKYATHQRHAADAITEFIGNDPDKFTFEMILSAYLGVNPMSLLDKIAQYRREGRTLPLVIGDTAYGKYRWTIISHDARVQYTDERGNILSQTVKITLQEYLRT